MRIACKCVRPAVAGRMDPSLIIAARTCDGAPAALSSKIASPEEMEHLLHAGLYRQWCDDYLK